MLAGIPAACGSPETAARTPAVMDSATRVAIRAESINAAAVAARPPSPLWDVARVSERLVRAGVNPRRIEPTPRAPDFFSNAETAAFAVARIGEVRVFIFPDTVSRRRATEGLDPVKAAPRGENSPWQSVPLLIISQNLAAVMLGGSDTQRERVQLALEAGLPR